MAITNDRNVFIGFHTTPEVKLRIEAEANRRGMSNSLLIHRILVQAFGLRQAATKTEVKPNDQRNATTS